MNAVSHLSGETVYFLDDRSFLSQVTDTVTNIYTANNCSYELHVKLLWIPNEYFTWIKLSHEIHMKLTFNVNKICLCAGSTLYYSGSHNTEILFKCFKIYKCIQNHNVARHSSLGRDTCSSLIKKSLMLKISQFVHLVGARNWSIFVFVRLAGNGVGAFEARYGVGDGIVAAKEAKYSAENWMTSSGFLSNRNCRKSANNALSSGCCLMYDKWSPFNSFYNRKKIEIETIFFYPTAF